MKLQFSVQIVDKWYQEAVVTMKEELEKQLPYVSFAQAHLSQVELWLLSLLWLWLLSLQNLSR
jgi:hypothetical protein